MGFFHSLREAGFHVPPSDMQHRLEGFLLGVTSALGGRLRLSLNVPLAPLSIEGQDFVQIFSALTGKKGLLPASGWQEAH